jgi:hypothetical protein
VARLVDRLEAKGLVERALHENDQRQHALTIPGSASRRVSKIVGRRMGVLRQALVGLSEHEVDAMEGLLELLLADLTGSRLEAERICRFCDDKACPLDTCPVEAKACSFSDDSAEASG